MSTKTSQIRIVFLAANPVGSTPLKLDEEVREIDAKIRASEFRDNFELITKWAVRPDDLLQALNQYKPHIVHFSGHGSSSNELVFLDKSGSPKPVGRKALSGLFGILKDNVRVVLLNACYSQKQAKSITKHIDCAIGMASGIGDSAAITFAASFYSAIGFGRSIRDAFEQGKVSIQLEGIPEEQTPQLIWRNGTDPAKILFSTSNEAKPPQTNLEQQEVYQDLWRQIEEAHIEIRSSASNSNRISPLIRDINRYIFENAPYLDDEIHSQTNEYLKLLKQLRAAIVDTGDDQLERDFSDTVFSLPDSIVNHAREVSELSNDVQTIRNAILEKVKRKLNQS